MTRVTITNLTGTIQDHGVPHCLEKALFVHADYIGWQGVVVSGVELELLLVE